MKLISVVGARPQFVKVAPIAWRANGSCEHFILNTGQHYDPLLSDVFFQGLNIPAPFQNLFSGSGTHAEQTAKILVGVEEVLQELKPDAVLIYGDTNSTLAAGLAAAKLGIPIGHIEAGLRSCNRKMPEEINRIISDHVSDFLFAPTSNALVNLTNEGLGNKSFLIGDIMVETLEFIKRKKLEKNETGQGKSSPFIYSTIHRAENTNDPARLAFIVNKLANSPIPVRLYGHPRLIKIAKENRINLEYGAITLFSPLPYEENIFEIMNSVGVISDSGGIQKESFLLSRPQLTVRNETEWVETLEGGWNRLDPLLSLISSKWFESGFKSQNLSVYGDGNASSKVLSILREFIPNA
jgi:UDP-N-acetylglucosamine 2-epimerase (non-hydrolysing)